MDRSTCDCGMPILRASEDLGCIECGRPCCPVCASILESVAYCQVCAANLLEGTTLSPPAAPDALGEPRGIPAIRARRPAATTRSLI